MKVNNYLLIYPNLLLAGCAIPYDRQFRPAFRSPHPSPNEKGEITFRGPRLPTSVLSAADNRPLDNVTAVIVIHRQKYDGLCCSAKDAGPCAPLVYVHPLANLPDFVCHQRGLILLFPFFTGDTAAEFSHADVFAYKPGFLPTSLDQSEDAAPVKLNPCPISQSQPALEKAIQQSLSHPSAQAYAKSTLNRARWLLEN